MIIEGKESTTVSNVPKENSILMSMDEEGIEHILKVLTNLYNDPDTAVIREYYTNAVDAHVEGLVSRPVEVTLPSWTDPTYIVRDFGPGMSEDDIRNVYSKYGASTKRKSNEFMGAFGLGCKSAFTITSQFVVVSVKHSMKTTALFSMNDDGAYECTIVSSVETDEGSGTTVKVPVDGNLYDFNRKAREFFKYSQPGNVLVDGDSPTTVWEYYDVLELSHDLIEGAYYHPDSWESSYIVMGTVPYEIHEQQMVDSIARIRPDADANDLRPYVRMGKVFKATIGSVNLTPNREGLRYTEHTKEFIDSVLGEMLSNVEATAQAELDEQVSLSDIYQTAKKWESILGKPFYRGEEIIKTLEVENPVRRIRRSLKNTDHEENHRIDLTGSYHKVFVPDHDAHKYRNINNYLGNFMQSRGLTSAVFYITDNVELWDNSWIARGVDGADFTMVSSEDLKKESRQWLKDNKEKVVSQKARSQKANQYPILNTETMQVEWKYFGDISKNIPYIASIDFDDYSGIAESIRAVYDGDLTSLENRKSMLDVVSKHPEVLLLSRTRKRDALEKRVKGTKNLKKEVVDYFSKVNLKTSREEVRRYETLRGHTVIGRLMNAISRNPELKVKDPILNSVLNPKKKVLDQVEAIDEFMKQQRYWRCTAVFKFDLKIEKDDELDQKMRDKYPLIVSYSTFYSNHRLSEEHMVHYANMVHQKLKV